MKHKTLKEAYESIGETPQVGDRFSNGAEVLWVDGWFFDPAGIGRLVYNSAQQPIHKDEKIHRNGKQIYPKANTEESQRILTELSYRFTNDYISILIDQLIDAKIKEAKGAQCNS